jgi:D-alanyl-D-alanine carboxypeptidase
MNVMDPTEYWGCAMMYMLSSQANITVPSHSERGSCGGFSNKVTSVSSLSFGSIMNITLQQSDNLYAEHFLRTLGSKLPGNAQDNGFALVQKARRRSRCALPFVIARERIRIDTGCLL